MRINRTLFLQVRIIAWSLSVVIFAQAQKCAPCSIGGQQLRVVQNGQCTDGCYPAAKLLLAKGYECGTCDELLQSFRSCSDDQGSQPGYSICLDLIVAPQDGPVFVTAANTWSSLITGDQPDIRAPKFASPTSCEGYPKIIDDLYIGGYYTNIDGAGNVLGASSPLVTRSSNGLPATGLMRFDVVDIDSLRSDGYLSGTILHEMGHVLGIGSLWYNLGLESFSGSTCNYEGPIASREWQLLSGCDSAVPLEQDGSSGTRCAHWDEFCLKDELMTGYLKGVEPVMSRITLGGLEDLGYTVDASAYNRLNQYTSAHMDPSCLCSTRRLGDKTKPLMPYRALGRSGKNSTPRPLSDAGRRAAESYGTAIMAEEGKKFAGAEEGLTFVGDKLVMVLFQEGGEIYSVIVVADN